MATWHQERGTGLCGLYAPHDTEWKCVSDAHGQPASSMAFRTQEGVDRYTASNGGIVIPPRSARPGRERAA